MTKHSEAGKGSAMRPTNAEKYGTNYDRIFAAPKKHNPTWPFPEQLIPYDQKLPKFNPNNHEDAPL